MRGHYVERKGGWDCHGLPVEIAVEQKLGFHSKDDIERYGVAEFNAQCRESVFEFLEDWTALTERIAFWVDTRAPLPHARAVLHRVGLVGAEDDVGARPALRGPPRRPLLRALRHRAVLARGLAGLRGRRGPLDLRALPGDRGGRRAARGRRAAGVDDDAVDARLQRRRGGRPRAHLRAHDRRQGAGRGAGRARARRGRGGRRPLHGRRHGRRRLRAAVRLHRRPRPTARRATRCCRPTSSPPRTAPASCTPRSPSARTTSGSAPSRASPSSTPCGSTAPTTSASAPTPGAGSRTPTRT